jgi:ADP-heptose:LPS heptosyltransferase
MVNFKIDRLPKKHIVDRYLETLEKFGISNDGQGLDHFIDSGTSLDKHEIPNNYIAISIGGAHKTKQIPFEKLDHILQTTGLHFVLIGGKDVSDIAEELADNYSNVTNLTGILSIDESSLVIRNSEGLITGDTGMMHIGAALKKRMLVFWGSTIPSFGMSPYYGNIPVEHINAEVTVSCRPCSKTGFSKCPKKHFKCMIDHDMEKYQKVIYDLFDR